MSFEGGREGGGCNEKEDTWLGTGSAWGGFNDDADSTAWTVRLRDDGGMWNTNGNAK